VERRAAERLMVLASMGLAESTGPKTWRMRRDFENVLRAMQRGADYQMSSSPRSAASWHTMHNGAHGTA
jgi:hypothetical protein